MPPLHTHITNHGINRPLLHIEVNGDNYYMTIMDENGQLDDTNTSTIKLLS